MVIDQENLNHCESFQLTAPTPNYSPLLTTIADIGRRCRLASLSCPSDTLRALHADPGHDRRGTPSPGVVVLPTTVEHDVADGFSVHGVER
ncbi:hypothetical protein I545_2619 [Mycobacterium kansasii 662]|uniref:Uncharacterized protein n=2 Tax=Mycobacterium kansasii TaxID=1768 RepID=A0A1V3WN11_MYCKA|nr:hypothetical protein I547_4550 [Mycobacterium kansasii 824]EUA18975.1 hypothetical protein I545_2619 [Mycobacterium kansasii 662]OOK68202.1 hypothetical protein BZL29_7013 [Mycobacterium kansasii]